MGHLHYESFPLYTGEFPNLPFLLVVTTRSPNAGARTGKSEVDGSAPPFAARIGHGSVAPFTLAPMPRRGGRSRPNYPCGKARNDTRGVASQSLVSARNGNLELSLRQAAKVL